MIRAVLVDDEAPARRKLHHLLASEADFAVIGEAGSGGEAVEVLQRLRADVAFLDIQLPDCTGFDVVESLLPRDRPNIVFVTAYDDFAVKAFDVHAVDYLLKPVEPERFARALQRIRQTVQSPDASRIASRLDELMQKLKTEPEYVRRLLIQEGERSVFVEVNRIEWIEAARNYACIHSGERTFILRSSLDSLSTKLDPTVFRRISRSEMVNINHIAEVRAWFHGDQKIVLKSGKELTWSRRYRGATIEELERA